MNYQNAKTEPGTKSRERTDKGNCEKPKRIKRTRCKILGRKGKAAMGDGSIDHRREWAGVDARRRDRDATAVASGEGDEARCRAA